MTLPLRKVTAITRAVVAEVRGDVEMLNVLATDGGSERVELLITIRGCHSDPCRLLLNITRTNAAEFEKELREKLREALLSH